MAVFKCKMCGGTLEVNNNESVATCEYCGTKQTLPNLDDEKRVQLYDRVNYFRRENEFDKAMGIYEMILSDNKEDCESYWGIVLCRYGIEYVEDPRTHKRIPTVNRAQFTSIFDDEDYKKAIEYADTLQKVVYEEEAAVIDKIQKGILQISSKEEPFDVFICYKETDSSGNRTQDSVYAQDIYTALTKEGYKVFFSRITLEDKLGSAYEPYIFAALNSAKVMLVVGTNKENFNAVWVKNEWSRYLTLIKAGKDKILIPVYKDISPYEMPEEFQYLQSQDMGKIGFMQDIIHGVHKLINTDKVSIDDEIKENLYIQGCNFCSKGQTKNSVEYLEEAKKCFGQIPNYKDSAEKNEECYNEIIKINQKTKQKKKKKKIIVVSFFVIVCIIISSITLSNFRDKGRDNVTTTEQSVVDYNSEYGITYSDTTIFVEETTSVSSATTPHWTSLPTDVVATQPVVTTTQAVVTTTEVQPTLVEGIRPGGKLKFGKYEQDGNVANGYEVLEWWAASVNPDNRQALLVCTSIIDYRAFNDSLIDVTWETSSIRKWLNSSFYNDAFSEGDKKWILDTKIYNYDNPQDGTDCGNDTTDKVFLLSYDEVLRFYPDTASRKLPITKYAQSKVDSSMYRWWSRTSGVEGNKYALAYTSTSFLGTWGTYSVDDTQVGVVPAIVISY